MKPPDVYAKSKIRVRNFIIGTTPVKVADLDTSRLVISFHGVASTKLILSPSRDAIVAAGGITLDNSNPGIVFNNSQHGPLTQCEWWASSPAGGSVLHVICTSVDCEGGGGGTELSSNPTNV